jgi:cell division septal protein FtsQ
MKAAKLIRFGKISAAVIAVAGCCWALFFAISYMGAAPRFEVKKLSVSGLRRVEENQIIAKAGFGVGANVFKVNLPQIRKRVEELQWVRYAIIQRVLPDQIIIKVIEREPIGLARIQGEIYQFDIDGKILDPDPIRGSSFPILDGLRADSEKDNLPKVLTYKKILEELGPNSLSQVHINASGEVTVVSSSDPFQVNLGATEFRNRWIKYLQLKPQIQQRYPLAVRVDLRFKNQVIVRMQEDEVGENIVWDAKRNTL